MKSIKSYTDYIENMIIESINNGELPLMLSDKLLDILKRQGIKDHPISEKLLDMDRNKHESVKQTLLDVVADKPDKLLFINSNKIIDELDIRQPLDDRYAIGNAIRSMTYHRFFLRDKLSSEIKIGRLINKLFPNQFRPSGAPGEDIESFMDLYATELVSDFESFEEVSGDYITYWYNEEQYEMKYGPSSLNASCMRHDKCSSYINFYAKNKDCVKLIILKDKESGLLNGRALLWKLDKINGKDTNKYFMDRVYFNLQRHMHSFIAYAQNKGYLYKKDQDSSESTSICNYGDGPDRLYMEVHNMDYTKSLEFPYMDTMYNYNPYDKILINYSPIDVGWIDDEEFRKYADLWSTEGKSKVAYSEKYNEIFIKASYNKDWVKNGYNNEWIKLKDAIYVHQYGYYVDKEIIKKYFVMSKYHNSYIKKDRAVYLPRYKDYVLKVILNNEYDFVFSSFTDEYIKKVDAIWSEKMESWIYYGDSIKIYKDHRKESYDVSAEGDPDEGKEFYKYKGDYYYNYVDKEHIDKYQRL